MHGKSSSNKFFMQIKDTDIRLSLPGAFFATQQKITNGTITGINNKATDTLQISLRRFICTFHQSFSFAQALSLFLQTHLN
jgi:hypothetical protein